MNQPVLTRFASLCAIVIAFSVGIRCSGEKNEPQPSLDQESEVERINDTVIPKVNTPDGLDLFIDSMQAANFLLDTVRIKNTMWSFMARHPKTEENGHVMINIPFPLEAYQHHFSHPKAYFFAYWNEVEQTFKNGTDYLLLTWTIDSAGIANEKVIYRALHGFMGNFPAYLFRSENKVYALCHRETIMAPQTQKLAEELRNFVDDNAIIHLPFGSGSL